MADLWLTAQAIQAAGTEMAARRVGAGARVPSATVTASRRASDAPAPAGAFLAEVDVDQETGVVTLVRLVQAFGAGSTEPLVEAKAEGDALRGAGIVLAGAGGSARARTVDLPRLSTLLTSEKGTSPLGTAPIGNVAFLGAAAAVANAVAQAVGARLVDLPLHPERVLAAIEEAGRS